MSAVNIPALQTLKTPLGSIRNSCTSACGNTRPFIVCRCAAIEGRIAPTEVMRLPSAKLKQYM